MGTEDRDIDAVRSTPNSSVMSQCLGWSILRSDISPERSEPRSGLNAGCSLAVAVHGRHRTSATRAAKDDVSVRISDVWRRCFTLLRMWRKKPGSFTKIEGCLFW